MAKVRALLFLLFFLCFIQSPQLRAQEKSALRSHGEAIPKGQYKTWSLFLVCNPRWMADDKSNDLTQLFKAFEAFGDTIGYDNLAVWFWKQKTRASATLAEVDLQRSSAFCAAYGLAPSQGPYVIVTSTYPDESKPLGKLPPNSALFALAEMKPSDISDLLAHLADKLVANQPPSTNSTSNAAPAAVPWDVRLLGAAQQLLNRLGCAWTFKIEAQGVKAELQSCTQQ